MVVHAVAHEALVPLNSSQAPEIFSSFSTRLGGLGALVQPGHGLVVVDGDDRRLAAGVVGADDLDEAAVAGRTGVGGDDAVGRLLLLAHPHQAELYHGVFFSLRVRVRARSGRRSATAIGDRITVAEATPHGAPRSRRQFKLGEHSGLSSQVGEPRPRRCPGGRPGPPRPPVSRFGQLQRRPGPWRDPPAAPLALLALAALLRLLLRSRCRPSASSSWTSR